MPNPSDALGELIDEAIQTEERTVSLGQDVESALVEARIQDFRSQMSEGSVSAKVAGVIAGPADRPEDARDISIQEYLAMYQQVTGRRAWVLPTQLAYMMGLKFKQGDAVDKAMHGKRVWDFVKPELGPQSERFKCMFHVDSTDRKWLNEIGLESIGCPKANIPTRFGLRRHMELKHKEEYKVIVEERTLAKTQEDNEKLYTLLGQAIQHNQEDTEAPANVAPDRKPVSNVETVAGPAASEVSVDPMFDADAGDDESDPLDE